MAYSDFKYPEVLKTLGLTNRNEPSLFGNVAPATVSPSLRAVLDVNILLATAAHSEAARSTWIVGPVLGELWGRYNGRISMFAGIEFNADPDEGLSGYCDFLIGRSPQLTYVQAPIIVIVEAKRDSIPDGFGQCIAEMEGAMRYNRTHGTPTDNIFGVITTGSIWKFLRLTGSVVTIDLTEYLITEVDKLLGIFTHLLGPIAEPAAA
jgi:hypothetical protein